MRPLTRRALLLAGLAGSGPLAGCAAVQHLPVFGTLFGEWPQEAGGPVRTPDYDRVYAAVRGEPVAVPAFDYTNMDPLFLRANVPYGGNERPGTVVVDLARRLIHRVEPGQRATRYGIGVGPEGATVRGTGEIRGRQRWPDRSAATAQIGRGPSARAPGHPPLGARLLLVTARGRDTGLSIHGTAAPDTVGTQTRSGSVRMIDQDVIDLFGRAVDGSPVLVVG